MEIKFIQTSELVEVIKANPLKFVEARLTCGELSFTHFFFFKDYTLFDEGIDGEEMETTFTELLNRYPNHYWRIDNIV
jgi:hypothetical protein